MFGVETTQKVADTDEIVAKVDKFIDFLVAFDINDLHQGNIGFRENGDPVLIDYSGFNSWDC